MKKFEIIIDEDKASKRLDFILGSIATEISRNAIQKAIRNGQCSVDGRIMTRPSAKMREGQNVVLDLPEAEGLLKAINDPVEIIWEDENIAVCNKPAGISVHPCPSIKEPTYVQKLLARYPQLSLQEGARPGIIHRLDKNTSGLLVIALNEKTRLRLSEAFANRKVQKRYLALVYGLAPEHGECAAPLGRHPTMKIKMSVVDEKNGGKPARTAWRRLWHYENIISLLDVEIYTGRTHQIRVHLSQMGFPIIGDEVYGNHLSRLLASRQMLHAWQLSFQHPFSGETMRFSVAPPEDFIDAAMNNQQKMLKVIITGNQGCGKSAFCESLAKKNIPVTSADSIVHELYQKNGEASEWIKFRFGSDFLDCSGNVNKKALFKLMEDNDTARLEIEKIIHSLVKRKIELFFQENERAGQYIAAAEIPLFFECGWQNEFGPDVIKLGINCPQRTRWQRIMTHRGWTDEKIISLEKWQWPEEKKMAHCDYVIQNSYSIERLEHEADIFLDYLKEQTLNSRNSVREILSKLWNTNTSGK